jgi:hypothetical protein
MKNLEELIRELPEDLQQEVEDFARFLLDKRAITPKGTFSFTWEGALAHLRDQCTSVELQHTALGWWGD